MSHAGTGRKGPDPAKLLDEDWIASFLADVAAGAPGPLAAEANGLNRWTYYSYLQRGGHPSVANNEKWVSPESAVEPYASFVQRTLMAEARAHLDIVHTVHRKVKNDVNAAIRYMRTRYADDYVRSQPPIVVNERESTVTISLQDFRRLQREAEDDHHPDS